MTESGVSVNNGEIPNFAKFVYSADGEIHIQCIKLSNDIKKAQEELEKYIKLAGEETVQLTHENFPCPICDGDD